MQLEAPTSLRELTRSQASLPSKPQGAPIVAVVQALGTDGPGARVLDTGEPQRPERMEPLGRILAQQGARQDRSAEPVWASWAKRVAPGEPMGIAMAMKPESRLTTQTKSE